MLDSVRLRRGLAENYDVAEVTIPAFVYGKERDNTLISWLSAPDENDNLLNFKKMNKDSMRMFAMRRANQVYQVEGENYSQYGTTACVVSICNSILRDEHRLRCVTFLQEDLNICLSVPAVITEEGVTRFASFKFDENDRDILDDNIKKITDLVARYKVLLD
jgi:L-lactate dehydrogenase